MLLRAIRRNIVTRSGNAAPLTLKARLQKDMITALKTKDSGRASVLKQVYAEIVKSEKLSSGRPSEVAVLQKCVQRWLSAIEEYRALKEGRSDEQRLKLQDAIDRETLELAILKEYLPLPYSHAELSDAINGVLRDLEITHPAKEQSGRVMKRLLETLDHDKINKKELALMVSGILDSGRQNITG
ncbi:hypothetical protein PSACC_03607 [Paramicrosporidium saccamoebae]|uniref:Altered inheritance of mitochondria protein 41 n=1 Tax=Paramicrosporidium saccamoebae TaxID=1246581 RepID=A0A2H9TGD4_9FUNG|nr:hypothetical protein PSACC_03607 [Paramicrosporidium saccamoebae]